MSRFLEWDWLIFFLLFDSCIDLYLVSVRGWWRTAFCLWTSTEDNTKYFRALCLIICHQREWIFPWWIIQCVTVLHSQNVTADSWTKLNPRKLTVQEYLDQHQWPDNQLGMDMSPFNKFNSNQLSETYVSWPYFGCQWDFEAPRCIFNPFAPFLLRSVRWLVMWLQTNIILRLIRMKLLNWNNGEIWDHCEVMVLNSEYPTWMSIEFRK